MIEILRDIAENPSETLKKASTYYVLVPVAAAVFAIFSAAVSLPKTNTAWQKEKAQYNDAQPIITEMMTLDPERLQITDDQANAGKFNYASAVHNVTKNCGIPAADYKLITGMPTKSKKQQTQSATVTLEEVDVENFARFLSKIQLQWVNLQCTRLTLARQKGMKDKWKGTVIFKYYY